MTTSLLRHNINVRQQIGLKIIIPHSLRALNSINSRDFHLHHSHGHGTVEQLSLNTLERDETAKRITLLGLGSDILLCGLKGTLGYMSGSAALIADALHSVSDLSSGMVTLGALRIARQPPNKRYPYGYGHYESLGSLGVAALLLLGAASSAHYAVNELIPLLGGFSFGNWSFGHRLDEPPIDLKHTNEAMLACVASIGIKEALFWYTKKEGQRQKSPVLIANAYHHRSDSITSVGAFLGIAGYVAGIPVLDPILGLAVVGIVAKTAADIGYEAVASLTDKQRTRDQEIIMQVKQIGEELNIVTHGELKDLHNIKCRTLGTYVLLDVHVSVDPNLSVTGALQASNRAKQTILEKIPLVKDVSMRIQAYPRRQKSISDDHVDEEFGTTSSPKLEDDSKKSLKFKRQSFHGQVDDLKTRSQFEIEEDIRRVIDDLSASGKTEYAGLKGVSHCVVHYRVSKFDRNTGRRQLRQAVEVNLLMDDELTLGVAKKCAGNVREAILEIPDVHDADIHIETLGGFDVHQQK